MIAKKTMEQNEENKKDKIALAQFQKKEATIILQDQKAIAQLIKEIGVDAIVLENYIHIISSRLSFRKGILEDEKE